MQSFLNVLKSRYFLIGFGFTLLIVMTFVLGAWLDWSMVTRLLITIGLLVLCIGIVVFEVVRASRSAAMIEQSIKMQAEQQRMSTRPDKQAEIEELQEQLETAIGKLKQSKLARGRRGRNALHALPWYMFIGPPGAGKTTAIQNSGLNFPVGADRVRGVGGTRNCDWFFSDQAILLDTAGRYMTEHEDEEEWHAFLDMLKDHRQRRPINGVIVGISIAELLDAAPDEIEWHANNIRRRVSELVERLGVRFPVYLVFTKCDLMQGFVNFFGDLSRREREQIWGCTLTEEQREKGDPRSVFEHEFDQLYDTLINTRTERLRRSMKRKERRKVYVFPLEFASAKDNLAFFIDQLFQPNPYQESPEFRGFYFTSGTQEGAPIDRVIQSISEQFDFAPGADTGTEPEMETKTYFIKDFFTDVVIPDQYMVEQTSSSARRGRFMRFGVGAAAAVLLGLFVVVAFQAVVRSRMDLSQVEEAAQAAAVVQWDQQSSAEDLERINQLREEVNRLERYEEDPPFLRWGFYQGGTVLEPARTLYYQKMRPLVRDQFRALERQLANQSMSSVGEQERTTLRRRLENYLLLSDSSRALSSGRYRDQLTQYLTTQMTQASGPGMTVSFQEHGGQIEQHVAAFVDGLSQQKVRPFEAQSSLVERITRVVQQPPTIETIYSRIKREGESVLPPVRLSEMLSQSGGGALFANQPQVSGFFTKRGWENFVQEQIQQAAKTPGQGDLIGGASDQLSEELRNADKVEQQLRDRYFSEYAREWTQFLRNIQYRPFGRLRATSQDLQTLGQYNSPLLYIMARVTQETKFTSMLDAATGKVQGEIERRAQGAARRATGMRGNVPSASDEEANVHPVNRRMGWLHRLDADKAQSGGAAPELTQALEAIRSIGSRLDGMTSDPARAAEFAAQVLNENGGEMDQRLGAIRRALGQFDPQARRTLFEAPILEGWEAVLGAAQQHLNQRWREEVYQYYQSNLAGRYPFEAGSQQDARLTDVETFFAPQQGIVNTFYKEQLSAFLRSDKRREQRWEGRGIEISTAAVRTLEKADQIANNLFSGGALQLSFRLRADQPAAEGNAPARTLVSTRIHGTSDTYDMGNYRPWTEFTWPGSDPGAMITVTTREGEMEPKQFDGAWAWFRLLEQAQVDPRTSTEYRVRWPFERSRYTIIARYNLRTEAAGRLFTDPSGFFRFQVPQTLN